MPDQGGQVRPQAQLLEALEERREVGFGAAAVAGHDRRDPVAQEVGSAREVLHFVFHVRVDIDEAGSEDQVTRLDNPRRRGLNQGSHGGDLPVHDAHVGAVPGVAGPVHNPRTLDQEVEVRRRQRCRCEEQDCQELIHR